MDINNQVECKNCNNLVVRIRSMRRKSQHGFVYVDDNDRDWNGLTCPDCKTEKSFNPDPISSRKCRECSKPLPTSRYFTHQRCSVEDFIDGDEGSLFSTIGDGNRHTGYKY